MGYSLTDLNKILKILKNEHIELPTVKYIEGGLYALNIGNGWPIIMSERGFKEFDRIMKEKARTFPIYEHHPILSRPDGKSRARIAKKIGEIFKALRFDKNYHLAMGDIRLTTAQQDDILDLIISDEELSEEEREKLREEVIAGKYE